MAITNDYGDTTIHTAHDNKAMEWLARGITIRMGGAADIAEYRMDGATAKRTSIHGTISLGIRIGRCLREARESHQDPFQSLIEMLKDTPYRYGRVIFEGKVADIFRRTTEGFAKGHATIESDGDGPPLDLNFQNEHLIARADGGCRAGTANPGGHRSRPHANCAPGHAKLSRQLARRDRHLHRPRPCRSLDGSPGPGHTVARRCRRRRREHGPRRRRTGIGN